VGKPHEVGTTELPHNDVCQKQANGEALWHIPNKCIMYQGFLSTATKRLPQGRSHAQKRDSKEGLKMCENTQQDSHLDAFTFGPENTRIL